MENNIAIYDYPVEKNVLRFYKYKFFGLEDFPVTIEAYNKAEARNSLLNFLQQNPRYQSLQVVSESLSLPIFGETIKIIDDIDYVWVGGVLNPSVLWMPLNEFEKLNYD